MGAYVACLRQESSEIEVPPKLLAQEKQEINWAKHVQIITDALCSKSECVQVTDLALNEFRQIIFFF